VVPVKTCISCGATMRHLEDYPFADVTKDYCIHCARRDGSLKTYDEALERVATVLCRQRGVNRDTARQLAVALMAELPAWKPR